MQLIVFPNLLFPTLALSIRKKFDPIRLLHILQECTVQMHQFRLGQEQFVLETLPFDRLLL